MNWIFELIFRSFKSWKTTLTAIIGFAVYIAGQYGVIITPEQSQIVLAFALLVVGFFSKDADASHTQE